MSTNSKNTLEDQEIDLSVLSQRAGNFIERLKTAVFNAIQFCWKNKITIAALFIVGVGLGWYLDKNNKSYDNEIIVSPNFNSVDYLYSKINLINSKIKVNDTAFLKSIGIQDAKKFHKIEIEPIIDVYKFINTSEQNFELLKLMAEDGDIQKLLKDGATSKNYPTHLIKFRTGKLTSNEKTVAPIMNFLNSSEYYNKIRVEYISNVKSRLVQNDSIIRQIDAVLAEFSKSANNKTQNDKMVYFNNENTQLNDVIKTKSDLIEDQGADRIALINIDKVVKENSSTLNIEDKSSVGMKIIVPLLFLFLYLLFGFSRSFYRAQAIKSQNT